MMNDRDLMENLLLTMKGACGLYMNGTVESATSNVHQTFSSALQEALSMEQQIYSKMSSKGWYPTEQAQQQQIDKVRQTYLNASGNS